MNNQAWKVIDLFSGAGGMSFGFHAHHNFKLFAAFDAEKGKPSSGEGTLQCNSTYFNNIGIKPYNTDLSTISVEEFKSKVPQNIDVFLACPPCTGYSRTNPNNHLVDDPRNSLVTKSAILALAVNPSVILMENARELIQGNHRHHYENFFNILSNNGYLVNGSIHFLNEFGLPQQRERALIIAVKKPLKLRTLENLWSGYSINPKATTVRKAFGFIKYNEDGLHNICPRFKSNVVKERMLSIPKDGGSWIDLAREPGKRHLLTNGMKKLFKNGDIGSFPDTYGRMAWDKPAPTIKRECGHVGNGRYAHPEENRLCTVREMAILQGFPNNYNFTGNLSNNYRHIGDAVPPLISYQLAHLTDWILSENRPDINDIVLDNTTLNISDIEIIEKNYGQAV